MIGNSVYAAAADGTLTRYDSGVQVWRISTGQLVSGGVGSDGRLVAVGTAKGEVLTFDAATGKEAWKVRVSSEVLAAPAVGGDNLVVVRSGDSRICCAGISRSGHCIGDDYWRVWSGGGDRETG